MTTAARIPGFQGEYLWELEIATRQLMAMAEALPADKFAWRPDPDARPVSAVLVHVAAGNFMLLEAVGLPVPNDLYGEVTGEGQDRLLAMGRRNVELEAMMRYRAAFFVLVKRVLVALIQFFTQSSKDELKPRLLFFGEETPVRRVYFRLLPHAHELLGQMIAFFSFNNFAPP